MTRELLEKISRSVIGNAGMSRIVTRVGSFAAIIDLYTDRFWYSFAAPIVQGRMGADAGRDSRAPATRRGQDWQDSLSALRAHFSSAERSLRFEFLEVLFPDLGPELERAGFSLSSRDPLMILEPGELRPAEAHGVTVTHLDSSASTGLLRTYLEISRAAFGGQDGPNDADLRLMGHYVAVGAQLCSLAFIDGVCAGAGCCLPFQNTAEIAGIGTLPAFRHRGVASTLTSAIVERFFGGGGRLAWLSAGGAESGKVYASLGFGYTGCFQLNYEDGCRAQSSESSTALQGDQ